MSKSVKLKNFEMNVYEEYRKKLSVALDQAFFEHSSGLDIYLTIFNLRKIYSDLYKEYQNNLKKGP